MSPIHAIGDIHGQIGQLETALELIEKHGEPGAPIVFCGDYVDRGPDSRAVIRLLMEGQAAGRDWICLMGNHDRFLLRYLDDPRYEDPNVSRPLLWTDPPLGGAATLASYGVDVAPGRSLEEIHADAREAVPQAHRDWIAALPRIHETGDQIFVHAGLRPGVALEDQAEDDLVWIRNGFLESPVDWGRLVVHGHTALDRPEFYGNRLNLDGGTGYGRPLVPALLEGRTVSLLGRTGREELGISELVGY
ncbi:metallophosphoesterase family protein [Mangrovicoccus algicola]|uniref:Serine/threonine protein phosphatase n=1 Tax=Mangrovicoccus algicola TaxID=2771008 RepID=A0A8J6ZB27_9RHOB|nr:metallophosphoesterase family protein [Mangrovicoccus algicola]MBE3639491.1 serine/threonine protein phosphatase [Mangrovicoccus algicola]